MLYRELDNITKTDELVIYETNLRDRFGPLPIEVKELINDNKQVKEAYENVAKSQGEEGANLNVQNLLRGDKNVQKS